MSTQRAVFQIQVSLTDVEPPIWRRVRLADDTTLHELHSAIQLLFSWYDYHLYEFEVAGRRFQAPGPESDGEDATQVSLADLRLKPGGAITYVYDFGDEWTHHLEVEDVILMPEADYHPCVVDGERQGPPEDCGGPHRFMQLLAALERPLEDLSDEDRELVEWAGVHYDPEEFSVEQAHHALLLAASWGLLESEYGAS